jgi:hypothetical protein
MRGNIGLRPLGTNRVAIRLTARFSPSIHRGAAR